MDDAASRLERVKRLLQPRAASDPAFADEERMNAIVEAAMNQRWNKGLMDVKAQLCPALFRCFADTDDRSMAEFKKLFPGFQRVAGSNRKDKEHIGDFRLALNHLKLKMSKLADGSQPSFLDWLGEELLCLGEQCRFTNFMERYETVMLLKRYRDRLEEAAKQEKRLKEEADEAAQQQHRSILVACFTKNPRTLEALRCENPALAESLGLA